jgi:hypothetical protein
VKRLIFTTFAMLVFASSLLAQTLTVTFSYPEASNQDITGFRLLRDGVLDTDNVPPTVRTFTAPAQGDQKDHSYTLVAVGKYGQLAESTPYVFKWVAPTIAKPTYLKVK